MTIAAGFLCKNAAVLCADTLYSGTIKEHDSKVDSFQYPGGKVAFAVAGNSAYAWSAIKKVREKLQNVSDSNQTLTLCERVLAREYRSQIFSHPNREKDYTLPYWIMLAFWSERHGIQLFVTSETSMNEVSGFECIGAGRDLAHTLIKPAFLGNMEPREIVRLASYALKAAKQYVDGCGGSSLFITLELDGSIGVTTSDVSPESQEIEKYFLTYEYETRKLLMAMANLEIDDAMFWDECLRRFAQDLMKRREAWSKRKREWEEDFQERNPLYHPKAAPMAYARWSLGLGPKGLPLLKDDPGGQLDPQSPKDDQLPQPPSPESHGGPSES